MSSRSGNDGDDPSKENLDRCRRCELWEHATQGVAGEGPEGSRLMLVGEQPGDEEDLQGRPFVGPAGRLLRKLLDEAGIPVDRVFLTNAVKHFFFEPRGKRRIHKTPLQRHIAACHAWLEGELARVRPAIIVTLGATALAATHGKKISIAAARSQELHDPHGTPIVASYHPSAILRAPDDDAKAKLRATLVADLKRAWRLANTKKPKA
jgi:DNA polymerase